MTADPADLLYDLTVRLKEAVHADRCTFWVTDRAKGEVYSIVALGIETGEIRVPMHRGVVGSVARTGQPLRVKDAYNDPRFNRAVDEQTGYRSKSMLTMAIKNEKKQVIGVLQALNKQGQEGIFTPEDQTAMQVFCDEAAKLLASAPAVANS
ncbi:MAG TPA: GAF domain-containing protein [Chloroflexota bacterium]